MPRDGSNIYTYPPGTPGIPDTTIESAKYNAYIADVQQDLNLPRPIVAGGTGATNATAARDNLDAEAAMQIVTDFNTHVWEAGSFSATSAATGGPVSPASCTGIVYPYQDPAWMTVEARIINDTVVPGRRFVREKRAGVWGTWVEVAGNNGGIMTGALSISPPTGSNAVLILNKPTSGQGSDIYGSTAGVVRWLMRLGDATPETGANAGSNFAVSRCNDAGTPIDTPLSIRRADGQFIVNAGLTVAQAAAPTTGTVFFGNTPSYYLNFNGTVFSFNGAQLNVNGPTAGAHAANKDYADTKVSKNGDTIAPHLIIQATAGAVHPILYLNTAAAANVGQIAYNTAGNELQFNNLFAPTLPLVVTGAGVIKGGAGYMPRQGIAGAYNAVDAFNLYWTGALQAWINTTNVGNITLTSDYRIKKDVVDLDSTWDKVKALRPISYTQAQYTPQIEIARRAKEAIVAREQAAKEGVEVKPAEEPTPMFEADDIERWGFIAHELQGTLIESAATGVKDDPVHVQSPNSWTVIAALTKALQEAMARIEALEAVQATP